MAKSHLTYIYFCILNVADIPKFYQKELALNQESDSIRDQQEFRNFYSIKKQLKISQEPYNTGQKKALKIIIFELIPEAQLCLENNCAKINELKNSH